MQRLVAVALALTFSVTAFAQTTPPPPMPAVPDEPLPEWNPPTRKSVVPIFLSLSPEMAQAQRMRQAGLWISSIGWIQFFAAGIIYAAAADVNTTISNPRIVGVDFNGNTVADATFYPAGEDKRNALEISSLVLTITGGAMALGGFALFAVGQSRISSFHKRHPKEPLPSLSGY
jgi:hypothetical protein